MAIVLGIDPGSRITGYGLIESSSGKLKYVASGRIKVPEKKDLGSLFLYQIAFALRDIEKIFCH